MIFRFIKNREDAEESLIALQILFQRCNWMRNEGGKTNFMLSTSDIADLHESTQEETERACLGH